MRQFRFFVCLFLALSLGAAAWPADKAAKRLYLPWSIFEDGIPRPDVPAIKVPLWLSLPVKVLDMDYPAFVAKKDKTPAEKFLAEVFAAATAEGDAVDKYLAGKDYEYSQDWEVFDKQSGELVRINLRELVK